MKNACPTPSATPGLHDRQATPVAVEYTNVVIERKDRVEVSRLSLGAGLALVGALAVAACRPPEHGYPDVDLTDSATDSGGSPKPSEPESSSGAMDSDSGDSEGESGSTGESEGSTTVDEKIPDATTTSGPTGTTTDQITSATEATGEDSIDGTTDTTMDATTDAGECTDGKVDAGEQCDDGDQDNLNGCKNDCTHAACGDGIISKNHGEVCDKNSLNNELKPHVVCNEGCGTECEAGFGDCDGKTETGCETKLDKPDNCNACWTECNGTCLAANDEETEFFCFNPLEEGPQDKIVAQPE